MPRSFDLISPKQAARAMGVSESSLKRWCDQGLIKTARTVGGHRKMPSADVLRFVRENNYRLVSPQLLGLPPASDRTESGIASGKSRMVDALLAGDDLLARQIVFDLYLARHSLAVVFDDVIAEAFHEIGDRWACRKADVCEERRASEITLRILLELRKTLETPDRGWTAMGGTMEGDHYTLPTAMADLVLRQAGFRTMPLGTSIPMSSLGWAVEHMRTDLFWLSVSHIPEGFDFPAAFLGLSQVCTATGTALVVGGRALTEAIRQRMVYSAYCDTMQQLEVFTKTLTRGWKRKGSTSAKKPAGKGSKAAKRD